MTHFRAALLILSVGFFVGCSSEPQVADEFVRCRSIDGDRTAIPVLAWEFEAVAASLKSGWPTDEDISIDIAYEIARANMEEQAYSSLQKPNETIETVLRELEVRGDFVRADRKSEKQPILLRRLVKSETSASKAS